MANDCNRNIVEKYICHKLSKRGFAWGFHEDAEDEGDVANNGSIVASSPVLVNRRCRAERLCSAPSDPHAAIHRVLREAGDELERLYQPDFTEMSRQLYLTSSTAQRRFAEVIDELFRDGVNWGRIIAFFEFGGTVCVECASKEDMSSQVDNIADWMTEYLNGTLSSWIQDNGGWEAFVELYDRQRDSVFSCSWPSIKTVFGLAAIGAASLTIGAYLSQK
ncbi:apoptosis regulator Bcl-2 [Periophthalmus magnuspinnatus]|uniref:Apoptosis regulator Bcl-2 family BH4 domain-containing protein n=1 Tax=Periophthalmus magnuspinnatus TaxID=409849 RepID=A0A3B4A3G8_9GOBI|nr:apoptosis regulator Bcl-2 [Periophthalmus magnuspinnatus]